MADNIEIKRDDQVISLRDYMDLRFRANEEQTRLAMAASKEAIIKSENATEKRFESVNEFRRTLADQALQFIPRVEAEKELESLRNKIEEISKTSMRILMIISTFCVFALMRKPIRLIP